MGVLSKCSAGEVIVSSGGVANITPAPPHQRCSYGRQSGGQQIMMIEK